MIVDWIRGSVEKIIHELCALQHPRKKLVHCSLLIINYHC